MTANTRVEEFLAKCTRRSPPITLRPGALSRRRCPVAELVYDNFTTHSFSPFRRWTLLRTLISVASYPRWVTLFSPQGIAAGPGRPRERWRRVLAQHRKRPCRDD